MPNTKEKGKLIEVLSKHILYGYATLCLIADELMADGVRLEEKRATSDGCITKAVREKLVELLSKCFDIGDSYCYNLTRTKNAFACGTMGFDDFEEFDEETVADIADHLISNGVTVQEWISVKDRLPDMDEKCLLCMENRITKYRWVTIGYFYTNYDEYVTHWMPLPDAPKGE